MSNGQQSPRYTAEELEQLNQMLESLGREKVNEFGEPFGTPAPEIETEPVSFEPVPSFTLPPADPLDVAQQPLGAPPVESDVVEQLQQFGTVQSQEAELKARREFEEAAQDLFRANLRNLRGTEAYKQIPELQDLTFDSPDFQERLSNFARQQTIQQIEAETGLVPGFPLEGFAPEGQPMQSPAIAGQRLPVASPADLPGTEEPTLFDALSPQSRVGEVVARREEQLVKLKSADELITERGLDEKFHVDFAEKVRLERLDEDLAFTGGELTPEQKTQLAELQTKVGDKKQFEDIVQIGQIRAFESALNKYMLNESVARTKSRREASQDVAKDIEELKDLLEGRAKSDRYKKHIVGEEPSGLLGKAFAPQIRQGKVPILTDIQKDYFKAYGPILEQAQIDLLPYEIQKEEDPRQVTLGDEGPSIFADKPEPISKEKAYANYKDRLDASKPVDFFAVDFWEDPEKYVNEKGLWSWFNQSYPSGASVEGPGSVLLRWVAAPFNLMSTELYQTARGKGILGALGLAPDVVEGSGLREPSDLEKIAYGMDPKYAGHPYLRSVAENRFIGDDIYDLYWYNGYKNLAIVPGLIATAGDIAVTPGIPLTGPLKAVSAAAKSAKAAKAIGMPVKLSDVSIDAVKALAQSFADTSPLLEIASKKTGVRLADPSEFAALRATEFMEGANAYRAAKADVVTAGAAVTPEEAHKIALEAARESLASGTRGNSFLDYATKKGVDWADNAARNVGEGFAGAARANDYRNRIYQAMKGISDKVPNPKKTQRLLEAFKVNYLDDTYEFSGKLSDTLKKIYNDFGPAGYARLLGPENYRFAQEGIVTALEASPLTRGAWRNLKHITETLLVDPKDLKRLVDLVVESPTTKRIKNIQDAAETQYGLHSSFDANIEVGSAGYGNNFTPKVGTFVVLDDDAANDILDTAADLFEAGYLNKAEYDAIVRPIEIDLTDYMRPEDLVEIGADTPGFGKIISTDNMRRLVNASIEQVAFNNKIGVTTKAFEQATTGTKKALRKPLEARHLAAAWPLRAFDRVMSTLKSTKRWSNLFPKDTPLNVVNALEKLRGKLSAMNVNLRRDIKQLVGDPELQKSYFTSDWLSANKVTRDDAIVALALGPIIDRDSQDRLGLYVQSILAVMTAKAQDLSLDFLDAFKPASIQRSDISSTLSAKGKKALSDLLSTTDPFGRGINLPAVNGADDFVEQLDLINTRLREFIKDPENFKDPKFIFQVADADFPNITAGFYYVQKQRQLKNETIADIGLSWPGVNAQEAVESLRASNVIAGETFENPVAILLEGLGLELPTPGEIVSSRLIQMTQPASNPQWPGYKSKPRPLPGAKIEEFGASTLVLDLNQMLDPNKKNPELFTVLSQILNSSDPEDIRLASSLIEFHDSASELAETIITNNRLNSSDINQNLSFLDSVFDLLTGVKAGESARLTGPIIAQKLASVSNDREFIGILTDALMGVNRKAKIDLELNRSKSVIQMREALIGLFRTDATVAYRVVKTIDSALKWYTRSAYQQILAGRPAFHAVNVATGPLLVWGTVGGRAALDSVVNILPAIRVLLSGKQPWSDKALLKSAPEQLALNPRLNKVAVTDPFGRAYTYADIYQIAFGEGALRSRTSVTLSATQYADMLRDARIDPKYSNFITKGMNKIYGSGFGQAAVGAAVGAPDIGVAAATAASGVMGLPTVRTVGARPLGVGGTQLAPTPIASFLSELTEVEDNIFRLATVIGALKRGDDPIQALGVGKAALLDYGSLNPVEQWSISRFAMFYSFWRLNSVNTLTTLLENPKRLVNINRAVQGGVKALRSVAGEDNMEYKTHELDFYKHGFMLGRPVVKYTEGVDRQSHYQVLPGVPILDGMTAVAQIMFAPGLDAALAPIRGLIAPIPAALSGAQPSFQWKKKYIDPRDMYVLDKTWWGNYFWSTIIGEQPIGKPAVSGQEAWQGQQWTLSESGFNRYLQWKNGIGQMLVAPGIVTNSSLPTTMVVLGTDPELTGRRFPQSRGQMALTVSGLLKDIGTLPRGQARTKLLEEMARRIKAMEQQLDPKKR